MGHYDYSSPDIRCDGDHDWGELRMTKSSTSMVLEDGEPCLKISWVIRRSCTNDHTTNISTAYQKCQKAKTVDNGHKLVPVSSMESLK